MEHRIQHIHLRNHVMIQLTPQSRKLAWIEALPELVNLELHVLAILEIMGSHTGQVGISAADQRDTHYDQNQHSRHHFFSSLLYIQFISPLSQSLRISRSK
jgi:hypothetical protein